MNRGEWHELASTHALGAASPGEAGALTHSLEGDAAAQAELGSLFDAAAALAIAGAPPATPPAGLREKILRQIAENQGAARPAGAAGPGAVAPPSSPAARPVPEGARPGFHFVLSHEGAWVDTPIPGVRMKTLSVSHDMGYRVRLAELAPGGRFPEHDHHGSEELYVLSGHLQTEGRLLGPGDFLHAEPGSRHGELVSPDGCVALLIDRMPAV